MASTNSTLVSGWQGQPPGRGTFDILKSCFATIVLLCWSSVCPNVPSQGAGRWGNLRMRLVLFLLAILGPDFVFISALGQLSAAWRARRAFHDEGHSWTLRHCFFVNMGALHVRVDGQSFSVDCEQLLYLLKHDHVVLPKLSVEDIAERNKTDELARGLAIVQTLWFTISALAGVAQDLFLTTLELTTMAFVFMMICCSICWWRKPTDISRPIVVDVDAAQVLSKADHGRTPLSFLNRHEWLLSRLFNYYTQILWRGLPESDRFAAIEFPEVDIKWEILYGWPIVVYSCIFMAMWSSHFPTVVEQRLWQASAVISVAYGVIGVTFAWVSHNLRWVSASKEQSMPSRLDFLRNLSPDQDPALTLPARLQLVCTLLCASYCVSRAYILVEDLIGLREMPASAYRTVDWTQYSPLF